MEFIILEELWKKVSQFLELNDFPKDKIDF
jgi:hypothetical protein